jgi:thioredoxin 1
MNRQTITNVVAIVVIIAVVAGVAWFKSQRPPAPAETTSAPAPAEAATPIEPRETVPIETPTDADPVVPMETPAPEASRPAPDAGAPTAVATRPAVTAEQDQPAPAAEDAKLPRLVDLGADKCIPCKKLAPILRELRDEYEGRLSIEFIDVWKNPSAKDPYHIRVIPTQILFDNEGNEVWRHEGFIPKEELKALFKDKVGVE